MSELIKKACASVGGTYSGGACRCSDGSLKNMVTGECVSEASAGPVSTPAIAPIAYTPDEAEAADPNGSPRLKGSRDRYYMDAAAFKGGELDRTGSTRRTADERMRYTGGTSSPAFVPVVTDQDGGRGTDAPTVELGLAYDPNGSSKPAKRRTGTTAAGSGGTDLSATTDGEQTALAGIPPALILGALSFLVFRS